MAKSKKIADENQTDEKQVELKAENPEWIVKPEVEKLPDPVEDPVEEPAPIVLEAYAKLDGTALVEFNVELSKMEKKEFVNVLINELKKI